MTRILLVGPLPPPMGGNTRHFATLTDDLKNHPSFRVKVINTSRGQGYRNPLSNLGVAFKTLFGIVVQLPGTDVVSYQASDRGMFLFGPFVVLLGKLYRTPTVLRLFGGSFGDFYQGRGRAGRAIVRRLILSADVVLLQTRRTIKQLEGLASGRLVWFSTYIKVTTRNRDHAKDALLKRDGRCTRFIFLGHVARAKGLETMLDAADRLPADCTIDIYGPLDEYTATEIDERGRGHIRYCGFLTHHEVDARLWDYDCLVLPTYYPGEGYPGVIAEAFAHGLPVIASNWMAIPEMVDEHCGILIEPRDVDAFVAAIDVLNHDSSRWLKMKERAFVKAQQFDHTVWSERFEVICKELARNSL